MGLPSSAKNVTISGDGLTAKNGTRTVKFGTMVLVQVVNKLPTFLAVVM